MALLFVGVQSPSMYKNLYSTCSKTHSLNIKRSFRSAEESIHLVDKQEEMGLIEGGQKSFMRGMCIDQH